MELVAAMGFREGVGAGGRGSTFFSRGRRRTDVGGPRGFRGKRGVGGAVAAFVNPISSVARLCVRSYPLTTGTVIYVAGWVRAIVTNTFFLDTETPCISNYEGPIKSAITARVTSNNPRLTGKQRTFTKALMLIKHPPP